MNCRIRKATPEDAEALIAHVQAVSAEPGANVSLGPGEFQITLEKEREFLEHYAAAENSTFLVAEVDGHVVGSLMVTGGTRRANRHEAALGITIDPPWRNQGIGTALMRHAVEWARSTGILTRIQLFVFARNAAAIHLYEKFGFQVEGRRRRAIRKDGEYLDDLLMALLL